MEDMLEMMRLSQDGFYCSQIIIQLGLKARGENDPALVRAMRGLALGGGSQDGVCGALSGAACLLSLYGGKGTTGEHEDPELHLMLSELSQWFVERYCQGAGPNCSTFCEDGQPVKSKCAGMVLETYRKTSAILAAHGLAS